MRAADQLPHTHGQKRAKPEDSSGQIIMTIITGVDIVLYIQFNRKFSNFINVLT